MKKIFLFLFLSSLFFSCKKENIETNNTELWIKVSSSIESLNISFAGINTKGKQHSYNVEYLNGVFTPTIKQVRDDRDGGVWFLVYTSLEKSDEVVVTYNNKEYKTRGFYLGERRFMEIVLSTPTVNGEINTVDYDITQINRTVWVE